MNQSSHPFPISKIKAACIATISAIEAGRKRFREDMIKDAMEPFRKWGIFGEVIHPTREMAIELIEYQHDEPWASSYYDWIRDEELALCHTYLSICEMSQGAGQSLNLTPDEFNAIGMAQYG